MLKVYILIVVLGLVGGVVYGGYYYYKDTQARIATLTENSAKLEVAAKTQKNTIDTLLESELSGGFTTLCKVDRQLLFHLFMRSPRLTINV